MKQAVIRRLSHTLVRYFLSYFLIASILLLGFSLVSYKMLSDVITERMHTQTVERMEYAVERIQSGLKSLSQAADAIAGNSTIVLSRFDDSDYARVRSDREVSKYAVVNDIIDSIVYYNAADGRVYSSMRLVRRTQDSYIIYDAEKALVVPLEEINGSSVYNRLINVSDGVSSYLIYCSAGWQKDGYELFFILNSQIVGDILKGILSEDAVYAVLTDDQGRIIAQRGEPLDANAEQDMVQCDFSVYNKFHLTAHIFSESIMSQVNSVFQRAYYTLLLLGVVAIMLVMLAMKFTYTPLKRLTNKFVKSPVVARSYIDQLDNAFSNTLSQNRMLQTKIDQYRLTMQKSVLDAVISDKGTRSAAQDFCDIEPFFTMEPGNRIFILCMRGVKGEPFPATEVAQYIRSLLPEGDTCVALEILDDGAVFLLNYSGLEQPKENVIGMMLTDIYHEKGYYSALSNGSSSPLDIPTLYENARRASELWVREPVVLHDAVKDRLALPDYPHDRIEALSKVLSKDDFAEARRIVNGLFALADQASTPDSDMRKFYVQSVLIDMLTAIVSALNAAHIKFKEYSDIYLDALFLCRSCPYADRKADIRAHMDSLISVLEQNFESKFISAPQIRQIVEEKWNSPDFSIATLAGEFNVSVAYMSYLYKKEMGENFSDHLWRIRLEKAMHLLSETDMSIDDISMAVGYANTSSFRRKFKQEMGYSPSQARKTRSCSQ